jgi:hypothetical protein
MTPRYLVQVRRVGEPWLTVERYDNEHWASARAAGMWRFRSPGLHVRVIHRGREIFNPRRAA